MSNITVQLIDGMNFKEAIPGIVHVFRDDEVVPWHRQDECLEWIARRTERGFYITVACDGDTIVGYSEWIETYDDGRKLLYLGIMQVDCDLRSRGIGKVMLDDGEKYAINIGASHLRTIPEDERSHNFYRKYGFYDTDTISHFACHTSGSGVQCGEPITVTLEIVNTHEFVFGLGQSSGRHMFECANHHPESSGYTAITMNIPDGYLQFRHKKGTKNAEALYWSNNAPTVQAIANILVLGREAGFDEVGFSFRTKYKSLFTDFPIITKEDMDEDEIELERSVAL